MGLLKKIFSSSKAVDDVMDKDTGHLAKIGQFIGNQQFTEQEKATAMAGLTEAIRAFSISTANQSTERSRITRAVAIRWITVQLGLVLVSAFAAAIGSDKFELLWQITTSDVLVYGTFGIMVYFFGAYGWGAHVAGKNKQ